MEQKSLFDSMNAKTSFGIGFVTAVLVLGTIGFIALGTCVMNGECAKGVGNGQDAVVVADAGNTNPTADIAADTNQGVVPVASESDYVRGDEDAPITMIMYSDFECPYCNRFYDTMVEVMDNYDGQVRWIYRHFPLSFHTNAQSAAEAAECAGVQGKFWEMADLLSENYSSLGSDAYNTYASQLGLNTSEFATCMDEGTYESKVKTQAQGGITAGVTGTPGTFIISADGDAIPVKGALPYDTIAGYLDTLLAE
jgi:protein-disulfide isomerase